MASVKRQSLKQKIIFLDRDGTIISENKDDFRLRSAEDVDLFPNVGETLHYLQSELKYKLVLVSNQDGLGSEDYPVETFELVQSTLEKKLKQFDVSFDSIHIDNHFAFENHPNRKPAIGMLKKYFKESPNLDECYVIGDSLVDMKLSQNLKVKGIYFHAQTDERDQMSESLKKQIVLYTKNWKNILDFFKSKNI
ncbi:MAG: HAD-IIIA family hydrolase [Chitinophagaceae bacterium]|nr:MAG: HAD-IIIA family hydrolase [Chitinophagaceae bacterium]